MMEDPKNGPSAMERERVEQASQWLMRLRDPQFDPDQLDAWLEWGRLDARNLKAFDDVRELAQALDGLNPEQKSEILRECLDPPAQSQRRRPVRRWRPGVAWAAGIMIGLATLTYFTAVGWRGGSFRDDYATTAGQTRSIQLPDGSYVELAARSSVSIDYRPDVRSVVLAAGEAYFRVRHDARRPFLVHAGHLRLTDIGTAFDVRRDSDDVVVEVAEGAVHAAYLKLPDISAPAAPTSGSVTLVAGQKLVANKTDQILKPVESDDVAEWRSGRLHFQDAALSTVVADVNRYSARQIVLGDPAVGRMRFTGTVLIGRVDAWLTASGEVFPLRQQVDADGRIVLTSKKPR